MLKLKIYLHTLHVQRSFAPVKQHAGTSGTITNQFLRVLFMSAFICNDKHTGVMAVAIFELLTSGLYDKRNCITVWCGSRSLGSRDSVDIYSAQMLADLLRVENVTSVDYRYEKSNDTGRFTITAEMRKEGLQIARNKSKWNVLNGMINCYNYQSCEHEEYEDSAVYAIIEKVRCRMLDSLVGESDVWEYV